MTENTVCRHDLQIYGAVFFDNESDGEAGWAAVAGKDAFRILSTSELPYDVYWWTSSANDSLKGFQPRLKTEDYLRPSMRQLHLELGLVDHNPVTKVEVTAEIFARVMIMARDYYGIMSPQQVTLSEDIARAILPKGLITNKDVNEALKQAYQTWVMCNESHPVDESAFHTLNLPRVHHTINVLSTPVPDDNWSEAMIGELDMPPEFMRMDWILKLDRPVLAKVIVRNVDQNMSALSSFGSGARIQRSWMTHPELLVMSKFSDLKIEGVFLSSGYKDAQAVHTFYTGGDYAAVSISAGIMASNYCAAMIAPQVVYKNDPNKRIDIFSPQATWLAASDRLITLTSALALQASGFAIKGYGMGKIIVGCPPGATEDLRDTALLLGLEVPLPMATNRKKNGK